MKKIFLYIILLAALSVQSCTKDADVVDTNPPSDSYRLKVEIPKTRLDMSNGEMIKWDEHDKIYVYELGENFTQNSSIVFDIDPSSISKNGKTAEFYSEYDKLNAGTQYIALVNYYNEQEYTDDSTFISLGGSFDGEVVYDQFNDSDDSLIEQSLILSSQVFTPEQEGVPSLYFSLQQSLLELDIMLNSGSTQVSTLTITTNNRFFLNGVKLYSDGFVGFKDSDNTLDTYKNFEYLSTITTNIYDDENSDGIGEPASIGVAPYKLFVPVIWNPILEPNDEEILFSITTPENKFATVSMPIKKLTNGITYYTDLVFSQPIDYAELEQAALIQFRNDNRKTYSDTWDIRGFGDNWYSKYPFEEWYGVEFNSSGRVVGLNMSGSEIEQHDDLDFSALGELIYLEWLDLSNSNLSRSINSSIGQAKSLKSLNLSNNNFEGTLPVEIASLYNLEQLLLSGNNISGSIPEQLFNLAKLKELDLSNTKIDGAISPSIGALANLEELRLNNIPTLTGELPEQIGQLTKLRELHISFSGISGSIPTSFANLPQLETLNLASNKLSGIIPTGVLSIATLEELILMYNNFTDNGNSALYNHSKWDKYALNVLTQNTGYGFERSEFRDISILTENIVVRGSQGEEKHNGSSTEYLKNANMKYTLFVADSRKYSDLFAVGQEAHKVYNESGLSVVSYMPESEIKSSYGGDFITSIDGDGDKLDNRIATYSSIYMIVDKDGKIISHPFMDNNLTIEDYTNILRNDGSYQSITTLDTILKGLFPNIESYISADKTTLIAPTFGGSLTLRITSNTDWTISTDSADWIILPTNTGSQTTNFVIDFAKNDSGTSRNGSITISGGGKSVKVEVSQSYAIIDDMEERPLL